MNIYQKMSAITTEISAVAKNLEVGTGKSSYKAVGEADVLHAVKPIEAKNGIYSYPYSREIIDSGEMVSTNTYNGNTVEKRQLYLRVKTVYRFVNMDDPAEYIDITTFGDGVDTQDKAPGKAMTYADKYALLKAYKIITGDDPDQEMSGELSSMKKDRTGEPAYPPVMKMAAEINNKAKQEKALMAVVLDEAQKSGVKSVKELAEKNPVLITALWNKWCNK